MAACAGNKATNRNHLNSTLCGYVRGDFKPATVSLGSAAARLAAVPQPPGLPGDKLMMEAEYYYKTK